MTRPHLRGQTPRTLSDLCMDLALGERVAGKILARAVGRDSDAWDDAPGLSKAKAAAIRARTRQERLEVRERTTSGVDGFRKWLLAGPDGATFEAVRIPLELPRWSACVSSQAGCALACAFCQTGRIGLGRHLEAWEIVEQVLTIRRESPERPVTGVVFQGQGEPLHNYDEVIRAAEVLRDPCGAGIRGDRMTISTVGLTPAILRYTAEGHPYRLILSLTSAFQEKRESLLPVARAHEVGALAEAISRHARSRRDHVHLGWVLMSGINTQPEEAREIRRLFPDQAVRVHVIDVNDPEGRFERAGDAERARFLGALAAEGLSFVRRYSGGPDIHAACGMLANVAAARRA
jgi:23S rRNA (adenine2503-C2)-methyltransferase